MLFRGLLLTPVQVAAQLVAVIIEIKMILARLGSLVTISFDEEFDWVLLGCCATHRFLVSALIVKSVHGLGMGQCGLLKSVV